MRIVLVALMAALMAALPTVPATAQQSVEGLRAKNKPREARQLPPELQRKKTRDEERAAKSALERLPDKPYDPWRNTR